MTGYSRLIRPLLFKLDPEVAHNLTMRGLQLAGKIPLGLRSLSACFDYQDPRLETEVLGLRFRNPVGLAAGYDKDATATRELGSLGFGHVEVGTVSPSPQPGNSTPRVFRLSQDQAVINRMGFPNQGAEAMQAQLQQARRGALPTVVGVSIGKGRHTPLPAALGDYGQLLARLHPFADYIAVNISSPNTPGLRDLQARHSLHNLLSQLTSQWLSTCPKVPLFLKIAPDLTLGEIDDVLDVATSCGLGGIIATNTALSRHHLSSDRSLVDEYGGLSGAPLRAASTAIIRHIHRQTAGSLTIIGVGGIDSLDCALEKIKAGASLVQVYTGLIYQGPTLVRSINRGLVRTMEALGVDHVGELVGTPSMTDRPRRFPAPALRRREWKRERVKLS